MDPGAWVERALLQLVPACAPYCRVTSAGPIARGTPAASVCPMDDYKGPRDKNDTLVEKDMEDD